MTVQHTMQLDTRYFEKIAAGQKTVEMRLYDEKRQKIKVGDEILFADRTAPDRTLSARVVALHRFGDFAALYRALSPASLGYEETDTPDPADMEAYYTKKEQAKYGVVGIEIALKNEQKKERKTMKVAVCGVWHVHATDYTKEALARGEVLGFYERDDALAAAFAEKHPVPRFATLEELLASDAEGVIVCSASSDHTEDIIRIAEAKKNIFTEKVLALTDEEADRIAEAVERNGVSLTISLFQKYLGSRLAVYEIAKSGELGKINYLRFRNCHSGSIDNWLPAHFYSLAQCGGGAMIDLGAHGMYLTHWILGMPVSAKSVFTRACSVAEANAKNADGVEDNAVTVMQFADGAVAVNETGFVSHFSPPVFEVFGEDGYVRMEGDSVVKCTKATGGKCVEVELPASLPIPIVQFMEGTPLPGCSVEEARALTHMMVMAYAKN